MRGFLIILFFVAAAGLVTAAEERPSFQTLRYNEDWSFLKDPAQRTDLFDPAKYIPFNTNGDAYVSFGGEGRLKYELYTEPVLNQQPADPNGFLLQRYLLHTDIHAAPSVRVFLQLESSLEEFRNGGPRPTDQDNLSVHQAFIDLVAPWEPEKVTLRLGRQEFAYGSQRLISVRESPNARLSFDAARLLTQFGEWHVDTWLGQPMDVEPGVFDDSQIKGETFWGIYATRPLPFISGLNADFYYLGLTRENAEFSRGTANETRQSLGTRLFGKQEALDWNFEFVGQFGSFGDDGIAAWTAASDTGWTLPSEEVKQRLFLHADIASGDHGGSNLGTFNPLFPRGAYFNEASLIGPLNIMDLQPGIEISPLKTVKFSTSCDFIWRESLEDGVYGVASNLEVPAGSSQARYIGTFPTATISWQATRHLNLTLNYVGYILGPFLKQSSSDSETGTYFSAVANFRF